MGPTWQLSGILAAEGQKLICLCMDTLACHLNRYMTLIKHCKELTQIVQGLLLYRSAISTLQAACLSLLSRYKVAISTPQLARFSVTVAGMSTTPEIEQPNGCDMTMWICYFYPVTLTREHFHMLIFRGSCLSELFPF